MCGAWCVSGQAGSVTFGQIVKAGEPVFSALVNTIMYGKSPSLAKWLCLPVVIGGVVFSCMKPTRNALPAAESSPSPSPTPSPTPRPGPRPVPTPAPVPPAEVGPFLVAYAHPQPHAGSCHALPQVASPP